MSDASNDTQSMPPHVQLVQMAMGHWVSRIIYLAAKLGLADRLADGPMSAESLAGPTGTDSRSLYRFMRSLANLGVLTEDGSRLFALTPLGEALKKSAPGAAHASVLTIAGPWWFDGFGELEHSVRTGTSGFEKALGMPIFDFLAQNPADASLFSETMIGFHGAEPAAVAAAYDFSTVKTVVDVGGASGFLLTTILRQHPHLKGILFDLPHVVRDAPSLIATTGLNERVT
ncbi:MAG: methyltransferase, partial [Vicinamibacterales bacterium]